MYAFVSGDLRFTVEGLIERTEDGGDTAIAGLPPNYVRDGMVDIVRARRTSEAAAIAVCMMVGKTLHHADILITGDIEALAELTDWKHCADCFTGYCTARDALAADPELRLIGMLLYFAADDETEAERRFMMEHPEL